MMEFLSKLTRTDVIKSGLIFLFAKKFPPGRKVYPSITLYPSETGPA